MPKTRRLNFILGKPLLGLEEQCNYLHYVIRRESSCFIIAKNFFLLEEKVCETLEMNLWVSHSSLLTVSCNGDNSKDGGNHPLCILACGAPYFPITHAE